MTESLLPPIEKNPSLNFEELANSMAQLIAIFSQPVSIQIKIQILKQLIKSLKAPVSLQLAVDFILDAYNKTGSADKPEIMEQISAIKKEIEALEANLVIDGILLLPFLIGQSDKKKYLALLENYFIKTYSDTDYQNFTSLLNHIESSRPTSLYTKMMGFFYGENKTKVANTTYSLIKQSASEILKSSDEDLEKNIFATNEKLAEAIAPAQVCMALSHKMPIMLSSLAGLLRILPFLVFGSVIRVATADEIGRVLGVGNSNKFILPTNTPYEFVLIGSVGPEIIIRKCKFTDGDFNKFGIEKAVSFSPSNNSVSISIDAAKPFENNLVIAGLTNGNGAEIFYMKIDWSLETDSFEEKLISGQEISKVLPANVTLDQLDNVRQIAVDPTAQTQFTLQVVINSPESQVLLINGELGVSEVKALILGLDSRAISYDRDGSLTLSALNDDSNVLITRLDENLNIQTNSTYVYDQQFKPLEIFTRPDGQPLILGTDAENNIILMLVHPNGTASVYENAVFGENKNLFYLYSTPEEVGSVRLNFIGANVDQLRGNNFELNLTSLAFDEIGAGYSIEPDLSDQSNIVGALSFPDIDPKKNSLRVSIATKVSGTQTENGKLIIGELLNNCGYARPNIPPDRTTFLGQASPEFLSTPPIGEVMKLTSNDPSPLKFKFLSTSYLSECGVPLTPIEPRSSSSALPSATILAIVLPIVTAMVLAVTLVLLYLWRRFNSSQAGEKNISQIELAEGNVPAGVRPFSLVIESDLTLVQEHVPIREAQKQLFIMMGLLSDDKKRKKLLPTYSSKVQKTGYHTTVTHEEVELIIGEKYLLSAFTSSQIAKILLERFGIALPPSKIKRHPFQTGFAFGNSGIISITFANDDLWHKCIEELSDPNSSAETTLNSVKQIVDSYFIGASKYVISRQTAQQVYAHPKTLEEFAQRFYEAILETYVLNLLNQRYKEHPQNGFILKLLAHNQPIHENITPKNQKPDESDIIIVTELCVPVEAVQTALKRQNVDFTIRERFSWMVFYCATLAAKNMHLVGLQHNDIKTANVLISLKNKVAVLTDMGSSVPLEMLIKGKIPYADAKITSPEIIAAARNATYIYNNISTKSDTWSLGLLLFGLLSKERDFPFKYGAISRLFDENLSSSEREVVKQTQENNPELDKKLLKAAIDQIILANRIADLMEEIKKYIKDNITDPMTAQLIQNMLSIDPEQRPDEDSIIGLCEKKLTSAYQISFDKSSNVTDLIVKEFEKDWEEIFNQYLKIQKVSNAKRATRSVELPEDPEENLEGTLAPSEETVITDPKAYKELANNYIRKQKDLGGAFYLSEDGFAHQKPAGPGIKWTMADKSKLEREEEYDEKQNTM